MLSRLFFRLFFLLLVLSSSCSFFFTLLHTSSHFFTLLHTSSSSGFGFRVCCCLCSFHTCTRAHTFLPVFVVVYTFLSCCYCYLPVASFLFAWFEMDKFHSSLRGKGRGGRREERGGQGTGEERGRDGVEREMKWSKHERKTQTDRQRMETAVSQLQQHQRRR